MDGLSKGHWSIQKYLNSMDEINKNNNEVMPDDITAKLVESEKKSAEYLAGWQRAKADFLNYKKEEMLRFGEIARYGTEDLILDLIGVMDNFDLGLRALEKAGPVEKGIYMIRAQISDVLKRKGLERIPIKVGDLFDPKIAEAVGDVESGDPPGTILEEIEAGYRLQDKILRPARVKIAKQK